MCPLDRGSRPAAGWTSRGRCRSVAPRRPSTVAAAGWNKDLFFLFVVMRVMNII
jgi:hypothetical protein